MKFLRIALKKMKLILKKEWKISNLIKTTQLNLTTNTEVQVGIGIKRIKY